MDMAEYNLLLQRAMAGDHGAFEALLDAHRVNLMACIRVLLGEARAHAEDVFQVATLAAWQSLPSYRQQQGRFEAWLLQIARHKAIDKLRELAGPLGQARGQDADGASSAPGMSRFPAKQKTPSSIVARKERDDLLDHAVQELAERQRMAIELHALEGFTYAETAEIMSLLLETTITDGQVKDYFREGKKRLKELLPRESAIFTDVVPKLEK